MVHYLEEEGKGMRLTGTPIWHAIQLLNILENFGSGEINRLTSKSWPEAQRLALALIDITSRLDAAAQPQLHNLARANPSDSSNVASCQLMRKYQLIVMSLLKWKLSSPLLID